MPAPHLCKFYWAEFLYSPHLQADSLAGSLEFSCHALLALDNKAQLKLTSVIDIVSK
jgi:predicted DNA-binding protein (MmcQ/YjbR family)